MTNKSSRLRRPAELEDIDRYLLSGVCPVDRWERARFELDALVMARVNAEWLANRAVAREAELRKARRRAVRLVSWWVAVSLATAILTAYLWSIGQ